MNLCQVIVPHVPLVSIVPRIPKRVIGLRHGEALHNVLFTMLGKLAYTEYRDTTLTSKGMGQAESTHIPTPSLILVSPLMRTLQTAEIMWPNAPKIALECLQEYPQHTEVCNRRSPKSLLVQLFPAVDFSDLSAEHQVWPRHDPQHDMQRIRHFIAQSSAPTIAIVSHSTWLKFQMNGSMEGEPELKHCCPYPLDF